LDVDNVGAVRISEGRLFHAARPATQNARMVLVPVLVFNVVSLNIAQMISDNVTDCCIIRITVFVRYSTLN